VSSINGKSNAVFSGDFLGDWREEIIMINNPDRGDPVPGIYIFSTWYPSVYKFPYLMSDDVYYNSAVHQNVGYNVHNSLGYYIGSDILKE
jgi:rhamnogalacturonan endolyase